MQTKQLVDGIYTFDHASMAAWKRTAIVQDGVAYVPSCLCGDEAYVFMCLAFHGQAYIQHNKHIYVPLDWAEQEWPHDSWPGVRKTITTCCGERS